MQLYNVQTKTNQKRKAGNQQTYDGNLFKPKVIWKSSDNLYNSTTKFIIIFLTSDKVASHKKYTQFTEVYRAIQLQGDLHYN